MIGHKISQSDLAAMAGVARENVSRVMSDWKRNKVVTRSSGLYCLIDIATLKRNMDLQDERRRTAGDINRFTNGLVGQVRDERATICR